MVDHCRHAVVVAIASNYHDVAWLLEKRLPVVEVLDDSDDVERRIALQCLLHEFWVGVLRERDEYADRVSHLSLPLRLGDSSR
jgi:hypothetical protein